MNFIAKPVILMYAHYLTRIYSENYGIYGHAREDTEDVDYPANIPTRYWLTPSGVRMPTSENTREIRSGLV